ncbi:MAG: hypothetical protein LUF82_07850 [Clostridia bacterium]|nr:hypothetical protein [Clostridia bacterium]
MKSKRILSVLFIFFFLAAISLSLAFVVQESDHCCTGADCVICHVLSTAEDVLGGGKSEPSAAETSAAPVYSDVRVIFTEDCAAPVSTPVTLNDLLTI